LPKKSRRISHCKTRSASCSASSCKGFLQWPQSGQGASGPPPACRRTWRRSGGRRRPPRRASRRGGGAWPATAPASRRSRRLSSAAPRYCPSRDDYPSPAFSRVSTDVTDNGTAGDRHAGPARQPLPVHACWPGTTSQAGHGGARSSARWCLTATRAGDTAAGRASRTATGLLEYYDDRQSRRPHPPGRPSSDPSRRHSISAVPR